MKVSYRVIEKKVPSGPEQGKKKFYGILVRSKLINYRQLCNRIMLQSSATRGDVSLILENFMDSLLEYLQNGHTVEFGSLGLFRLTAGSEGTETKEEFHGRHMKTPRVSFRPSNEVRERLRGIGFEKDQVKEVFVDTSEECPLPHIE